MKTFPKLFFYILFYTIFSVFFVFAISFFCKLQYFRKNEKKWMKTISFLSEDEFQSPKPLKEWINDKIKGWITMIWCNLYLIDHHQFNQCWDLKFCSPIIFIIYSNLFSTFAIVTEEIHTWFDSIFIPLFLENIILSFISTMIVSILMKLYYLMYLLTHNYFCLPFLLYERKKNIFLATI